MEKNSKDNNRGIGFSKEITKEIVGLEPTANHYESEDILKKRKQKIFAYLKKDKKWIVWGVFVLIAWFGFWIRTRNIPLLKDVTTGDFIQADPDATAFLRYAKYIVENGRL